MKNEDVAYSSKVFINVKVLEFLTRMDEHLPMSRVRTAIRTWSHRYTELN